MITPTDCASARMQSPVNYITLYSELLIGGVERDVSQQGVLRIGGVLPGIQKRLMKPGSCNSYILNKNGQQQSFYVSFNGSGKVDDSGFLNCSELGRHKCDARP